ncbi:MAG: hypothetical protein COB66_06395 [Coxiella sp. (in: Bacteria)]|nr:MAG: hypothetical protein COB66_06395 [Coxiella sp. (in: g-proteobacteria)]
MHQHSDSHVDYLILSAMPAEQVYLHEQLENSEQRQLSHLKTTFGDLHGKRCCVALTGIGTSNAAAIMAALIHEVKPKTCFFAGTAGAIRPTLKTGAIVLGKQAFEIDIQGLVEGLKGTPYFSELENPYKGVIAPDKYDGDQSLLEKALALNSDFTVIADALATTNAFPAPMHYFDDLKKNDVAAIDMESSAIYQVGWLLNVPSLVVRSISNGIDDDGNDDTSDDSLAAASNNAAKFVALLIKNL